MVSCSMARGVKTLAAAGVGVLLVQPARAAEPPNDGAQAQSAQREEVAPTFRIDLGMGASWATNGGGAVAGVGTLGGVGPFTPFALISFEGHLAGPVWLVVRATGDYARQTYEDEVASAWSLGLQAGPRFEFPVASRVDVGGHVLLQGAYGRARQSLPDGEDGSSETVRVGGLAGTSVHFRITPLFGVRLAIDVLRAGYGWGNGGGTDWSSAYAQLTADPSVALTFTF